MTLRHRCGLCMAPYPSYREAEACCTGHCRGASDDEVDIVRLRRRDVIRTAVKARCPPWFVWAMIRP